MPTYDYICQECGRRFDVRASMSAYSAGLHPTCPDCGADRVERSFSSVSVLTGSRSAGGAGGSGASCACGSGSGGFT